MSMMYCKFCDKNIDTDHNAEHFVEVKCEEEFNQMLDDMHDKDVQEMKEKHKRMIDRL